MKKFLIFLCSCLLLVGCNSKKEENTVEEPKDDGVVKYLYDFEEYKDFKLEDIVSYEMIRFTVAGDQRQTYTDRDTITQIYNSLSQMKIGNLTERRCEDNTTVFKFTMKDGKNVSVEVECDWVVIGKFRYEIIKQQ